jgi:predicted acylesterase/phospholipase RssA
VKTWLPLPEIPHPQVLTIPPQVLAHLEEDTGTRIIDHFDLIAGTSTGGIIALSLSIGMRPTEIVEFYSEHGPRIFPQAHRARLLRRLRGPRYRQEPSQWAKRDWAAYIGQRAADNAEGIDSRKTAKQTL